MLTKLALKNYKAFENESIELRPITVILGPNNSGKSSILSAVRVLSQTITSYDVNVPLLLNGALGDFGTYKDISNGNSKKKHIEFSFEVTPFGREILMANKDSPWKEGSPLLMRVKYKFRPSLREIVINELEVTKSGRSAFVCRYNDETERYLIESVLGTAVPSSIKSEISNDLRLFHFLPRSSMIAKDRVSDGNPYSEFLTSTRLDTIRTIGRICDPAYRLFQNMEYIGAMRQPPSRSYLFSGERHQKVGASGENAANIIAMDSFRKGKKGKNIKSKVIDWLKQAGMASDIRIDSLSDRHYELHIQNPSSKEYQNFADVGYGISQVIPVLVAGHNLPPGQTLLVEEPEIHLHPNAQAQLGDFFLDLYKNKVNSIIESHSEYIVVRLQQHVAAGLLNASDVAFYYVHANSDGKKVTRLNLDESGTFKEEWPQGFFPQRLDEAKKLAKLRAQKQSTKSAE